MSDHSAHDDGNNAQSGPRVPPSVTAVLYDADAEQRVELIVKRIVDGKRRKSKLVHILAPLSDDLYFQYEDKKNVRTKVSGSDLLRVRDEDKNLTAAEWLWDKLALRREGYVEREDWKARTNLQDKQQAIVNGLLAAYVVRGDGDDDIFDEELETSPVSDDDNVDAEDDDDLFDEELFDDDAPCEVSLDCLFNSAALTTKHFFTQPSAEDVKKYDALTRKTDKLMDGRAGFRRKKKSQQVAQLSIPSKARGWVALYNSLIVTAEGYVERVPAHHKCEAVLELFLRDAEVKEKK